MESARDRVELDGVADRALAAARNAESHRGRAVELGEIEAALVELQSFERIRGATRVVVHLIARAAQRVARVLIRAPRQRDEVLALGAAEEVRRGLRLAVAQIDHAAPRASATAAGPGTSMST